MTATVPILAPPPRTTSRQGPPGRWWWVVALLAVLPGLLPPVVLVAQVVTGGAVRTVPISRLLELLWQTGGLVWAVTLAAGLVGLATAWLTTATDLQGRRIWSTLVTLPLVIPSYVGALTLLGATGARGILSEVTGWFGWGPIPTPIGFFGAFVVLTVYSIPLVHLTVVPVLRRLDPALEDAARGLGAPRWRVFRTVTLPQLRPPLAAAGLLVALYAVSDFGAVSLLRYDTFTRAIYAQYQGRLDRRPAMTLAVVLIVVALTVLWMERRTRGRAAYHRSKTSRPRTPVALTRGGRVGGTALLALLVVAGLGLPIAVIGSWLARGVGLGLEIGSIWSEAARSVTVSVISATIAALAAIPVAITTVRYRSRISSSIDTAMWSSYALPHITVGLALVAFSLAYARSWYQSLALLIVGYVAMFLPQAAGSAQSVLLQVSPQLEEASLSLGRSRWRTLTAITIPLMARGLAVGAALVFLTVMKELPATLLLRPTGYETLAVRIWSTTAEGFYTRASAAALLLLTVSALPLYLLISRDLHD